MSRDPLRDLERDLYLASRTVGDLNAASRGPGALVTRLVRPQLPPRADPAPATSGGVVMAESDERTPEQRHRAREESNGTYRYSDGRPKLHRHFADWAAHPDEDCTRASSRYRVYLFDDDAIDEYDRHITERTRRETVEQVIAKLEAERAVIDPDSDQTAQTLQRLRNRWLDTAIAAARTMLP